VDTIPQQLAFWEPILIFAGYSAIIALGLYVSMSSGVLSIAHAALAGAGGYAAAVLTAKLGLPFGAGIAVGTIAGFVLAFLLGYVATKLAPLVSGLMTLAFAEVATVITFNVDYLGGANGLSGVRPLTSLWLICIVLALVVLFVWRYDTSRLGIAARATRDDADAAAAMGIRVRWVTAITFAIGGAIAALGGGLRIHYTLVQTPDDLSFWNGVNYLVFVVLGGSYVVWGPLLGAIGLTVLPELLRFSQPDRFIIYGALLTLIMITRPQGLIPRIPSGVRGARWVGVEDLRRRVTSRRWFG
jgi:branched-chain amino acid transport system permease protein